MASTDGNTSNPARRNRRKYSVEFKVNSWRFCIFMKYQNLPLFLATTNYFDTIINPWLYNVQTYLLSDKVSQRVDVWIWLIYNEITKYKDQ